MTDLGYKPNNGTLILTKGADWVCAIQDSGVVWPSGTECWIVIGSTNYNATVDPLTATASFVIQSDVCDNIKNGTKFTVYMQYPGSPTTEYAWFIGSVSRKDGVK